MKSFLRLVFGLFAFSTALHAYYDVTVTGSTTGGVWGTDIYRDNSDVATAAVHVGLIASGQTASIRVYLTARELNGFTGSTRNGVTSGNSAMSGGMLLTRTPTGGSNTPNVLLNVPAKVFTGSSFWVSANGVDPDGDLNSLAVNWSGVGIVGSWSVAQDVRGGEVQLMAPSTPGTFQLRGEVSDVAGHASVSQWYTIEAVSPSTNIAPVASIIGPTTLVAGQQGTWTYEATDANANLAYWKLSLGSTILTQASISGGDQTSSYPYTFATGGIYALTVYAEDRDGLSVTSTLNITVPSPPANYIDYGNLGGVSCYPDNSSMHPYARPGLAYSYSYLNDGSDSNDHGYGSVGGPNYLLADFGGSKKVLRLYTGGGHITGWGTGAGTTDGTLLQYSSDKATWTTAHTYATGFAIGGTSIDVGTPGVGIMARYWRIYRSDWMATTEFRFEGDPTPYILTVQNGEGTATGVYVGTPRPILANSPPASNYLFGHWALISGGGSISDSNSASTNFIMGASDAVVSAFYAPNVAPTALITGSEKLQVGEEGTWTYTADDDNKNLATWCVSLLPNTATPLPISGQHQSTPFHYTFTTAGDYTFRLVVTDNLGLFATSDIAVHVGGPTIVTQPQGLTVNVGSSASFSVTASSTDPLSYQWSKTGNSLAGATNASFSIASVQPGDAGDYRVSVSDSFGTVTSNVATLTVNAPPAIQTPPSNLTLLPGTSGSFTVVATGAPPLTYQWRRNGQNIGGATSATLPLANVQVADAGSYDVVVTNAGGSVTSAAAALTVGSDLQLKIHRPQ